jgi:hypothetical protein
MRDGCIVSDVVQDAPLDAAAELEALPLVDAGAGPARTEVDAADAAAARARERIPWLVYVAMFLGWGLGLLAVRLLLLIAGISDVTGRVGLFVAAQGVGLLCQSWRGASSARRRLGYPPSSEQRVRIALWYTMGTGVAATVAIVVLTFAGTPGLQALFAKLSLLAALTHRVAPRGAAVMLAAGLIFHAALVLLRYLLLTLFGSRR